MQKSKRWYKWPHQIKITCGVISVITDLGVEGKIIEISHEDAMPSALKALTGMQLIIIQLIQQINHGFY